MPTLKQITILSLLCLLLTNCINTEPESRVIELEGTQDLSTETKSHLIFKELPLNDFNPAEVQPTNFKKFLEVAPSYAIEKFTYYFPLKILEHRAILKTITINCDGPLDSINVCNYAIYIENSDSQELFEHLVKIYTEVYGSPDRSKFEHDKELIDNAKFESGIGSVYIGYRISEGKRKIFINCYGN